mgnify:CR=1 FL=1
MEELRPGRRSGDSRRRPIHKVTTYSLTNFHYHNDHDGESFNYRPVAHTESDGPELHRKGHTFGIDLGALGDFRINPPSFGINPPAFGINPPTFGIDPPSFGENNILSGTIDGLSCESN